MNAKKQLSNLFWLKSFTPYFVSFLTYSFDLSPLLAFFTSKAVALQGKQLVFKTKVAKHGNYR